MKDDDFDPADYEVSQLWRFTGAATTVAGFHPSVLIGLAALIPGAWLGIFKLVAGLTIAYAIFIGVLFFKWKITPGTWIQMQITKYVTGNKWRVR